jgi:hypothetical protein
LIIAVKVVHNQPEMESTEHQRTLPDPGFMYLLGSRCYRNLTTHENRSDYTCPKTEFCSSAAPCLQILRKPAFVLHRQTIDLWHRIGRLAGVAKLADALDLGSSALGVWVQVPPSAPATIKAGPFGLALFV